MSDVREYRPRHTVVNAIRLDGNFDLSFLTPNEEVRKSSNGKSTIITEIDTGQCIGFVGMGFWLVRQGTYLQVMDDEEFQRTYEEQS
jgi:hypothetical protein